MKARKLSVNFGKSMSKTNVRHKSDELVDKIKNQASKSEKRKS